MPTAPTGADAGAAQCVRPTRVQRIEVSAQKYPNVRRHFRGAITAHIDRLHGDFFFLKTDDWSSEHEYRVVVLDPGEEFLYVPYDDALTAVALGERFPHERREQAERAADSAGVQLLRLGWSDGRPFLTGFEDR